MSIDHMAHQVRPLPLDRLVAVQGGRLAARRHTVRALIEVDVTEPRRYLRDHKARTGESLSFTAFVVTCLGQAIDEHKMMHAYRDWRNRLILFDEVDVNMVFEIETERRKVVLPHWLRAVNKRSFRDLQSEVRSVQAKPEQTREFGFSWLGRLPTFAWDIFFWFLFKNPAWVKRSFGTVGVTAVGMFGNGSAWAIPFGVHTLDVAVGSIAQKPGVVAGRIEIREYLCLTLNFDHDIVDGAPAARFTQRFKELIESGYGLCN